LSGEGFETGKKKKKKKGGMRKDVLGKKVIRGGKKWNFRCAKKTGAEKRN